MTLNDILNRLMAVVALVVLTVAVCSCAGDDEPVINPGGGAEGVTGVGFTLLVTDSSEPTGANAVSRAPGTPDQYQPGAGYENYIDVKNSDFHFYFFSTADVYIGEINITSITPIATSPGSKRYIVRGDLPEGMADYRDFKVCVLANWKKYPRLAPGDDLKRLWTDADAIYSFGDGSVSENALIPLYGIKEYTGIKFSPEIFTDLDLIHLLRAYAKVEVNLDKTVYQVKSMTVTRVNATGYKAPADVNEQGDYVHGGYEDDYVNTPNIPADTEVLTDVPFPYVTGDNTATPGPRTYTIYLPEYDNTTPAATPARLHIKYVDSRIEDDYIDFKYYKAMGVHAKDTPFDILRNYWYRFNVSQGPIDLTVYVDVQPYAQVLLRPDFGLERDEEGYIIVRNNKGEVIKYIRTDGAELTLGDVDMPFYGTIRAVFDSKRRALLGYLNDGRRVFWNYDGDDDKTANMTSWEIYSDEDDEDVDLHLDEDYIKIPAAGSAVEPFTQSFYDDKGRVITRYLYPSNEAFESRAAEGHGAVELVSYDGSKYGAKVISYKDSDGKKYCEIKVTVDADGNETEAYIYY